MQGYHRHGRRPHGTSSLGEHGIVSFAVTVCGALMDQRAMLGGLGRLALIVPRPVALGPFQPAPSRVGARYNAPARIAAATRGLTSFFAPPKKFVMTTRR